MPRPRPYWESPDTIRDLYPELSAAETEAAEENLDRYVALALRIYERVRDDPTAFAEFRALTTERDARTLKDEGSNSTTPTRSP